MTWHTPSGALAIRRTPRVEDLLHRRARYRWNLEQKLYPRERRIRRAQIRIIDLELELIAAKEAELRAWGVNP